MSATIKGNDTLTVLWQNVSWIDKPKIGTWTWRGKGEVEWKKQETAANEPEKTDDAESPDSGGPVPGSLQSR